VLSDTLLAGLREYGIGPKIRDLRVRKGLGLVQLGEHTGLSPGLLSKIERGLLFPPLPTLLRIALVFGVGLDYFFAPVEKATVTVARKRDRVRLPDRPGDQTAAYFFESLNFAATDRKIEAYHADFPAGGPASEAHSHGGAELVFVTGGRMIVSIDGEDVVLDAGDAVYFDSAASHSYRGDDHVAASALVVVAPG
jgi:transcriptional regulator with XRE-family HTH domain